MYSVLERQEQCAARPLMGVRKGAGPCTVRERGEFYILAIHASSVEADATTASSEVYHCSPPYGFPPPLADYFVRDRSLTDLHQPAGHFSKTVSEKCCLRTGVVGQVQR